MDSPNIRKEIKFSTGTSNEIIRLLMKIGGLDEAASSDVAARIELMCGAWTVDDPVGRPKDSRREIEALKKSIHKCVECLGDLSIHSVALLSQDADEQSDDHSATSIPNIMNQLENVSTLAESALAEISVSRGPQPNVAARMTAYFVAECLWSNNLDVTTYDDGLYYRILSCALEEAIPGIGPEAHRRHGDWAIKNKGNIGISFSKVTRLRSK